jgi:DNA-binding transcriptional regulator YiaG
LTDPDLYVAAAEAIGESHRGLARRILDVDERTGRRWRAGEQAMSGPARQLCRALIAHPEIARELAGRVGADHPTR